MYETKVLEICENGDAIIELPTELLEQMGWKEGDQLDFQIEDGGVIVRNLTKESKELC
jgi:bifunctional DNA-binding transcriptional regulator/antitoxin component of YhaV-PrlF toxin-antitoxin module